MIKRIVRMSFEQERTQDFLEIFNNAKEAIRNMPGCSYLSLHQDHHDDHIYYTLSHWETQNHLDNYRNTKLFKSTWKATKVLFKEKAQAFSLELQQEVS